MADLWPSTVTDIATYAGRPVTLSFMLIVAEGSLDADRRPPEKCLDDKVLRISPSHNHLGLRALQCWCAID